MNQKWFANSKTIIFNVIVLVLAVVAGLGFKDFIPGAEVGEASDILTAIVPLVVALVNIVLRSVTSSAVTLQKPAKY